MSKLIKKVIAVATGLTVVMMIAGPSVPSAQALTAAELQAQINELLATLAALQEQLTQLEGGTTPSGTVPSACTGITFERALKQGMTGSDVKCLQALLNTDTATKLADSGPGSPGSETTYFGPITKAGVVKFQEKYASAVLAPWGLTAGTGYVGSTSRDKLNSMITGGTTTPAGCDCTVWASGACGGGSCSATQKQQTRTCTPSACAAVSQCVADATCAAAPSTGVTVSLAADTPQSSSVAIGAYNKTFVKLNFAAGADADYTITTIYLRRDGISEDDDVTDIKLFDGSTQIGNTQALNTITHKVKFTGISWTIPAGTTKVLTVKATIDATNGTTGNQVNFGIASASDVTIAGGTVLEGTPVYGNGMTIAGASVGDFKADVLTTPGASNIISGATDQHVGTIQFTASSTEGFDVKKLVLEEIGTSAKTDIKNIKLKYVGEQVGPTVAELTDDDEAIFENSDGSTMFSVKAGTAKRIDIYVDVTDGVRTIRTVEFQLTDAEDVEAYGQNTGGAAVINSWETHSFTTDADGAAHNIVQGTLTVNLDSATNPSATNFVVGTEQNTIISLKFSAGADEGVKITKLRLTEGGTIASSGYQNVQLYVDSASASTGHVGSVSGSTITFTDNDGLFTVEKSKNTVVKVKADISTSASVNQTIDFYIATVTDLTIYGLSSSAKIDSTATNISITAIDTSAEVSTHIIKANGNLTISNAPDTPAGVNLTKGQENVEIIRFRLAAEYEDMAVASIRVRLYNDADISDAGTDTAATSTTYLSNLRLYDVTDGANSLLKTQSSPSAGYVDFSPNITVNKDTTKTFKVLVDIPTTTNLLYIAGAVGAYNGNNSQITVGDELTTTGGYSAQDITETGGAGGNVFTFQTPTLAVDASAYPPASNPYVVTNTASAKLGRLVLTGSYEDIKVTQVVITFDNSATIQGDSSSEDVFTNVKIKVGDTQIGSTKQITDGSAGATVTAQRDRVTFDSINNLTIKKDQSVYLDVYADVTATSTDTNAMDWYVGHASNSDIVGSGLYSNTAVNSTGDRKVSNKTETLASGTLTISVDADTPIAKNAAVGVGGAAKVEFSKLKFEAQFEDMNVKKLQITLTDPDAATDATTTAGSYDFNKVFLFDGSTQVAEATIDPTNSTALFQDFADEILFTVQNGIPKIITVKGDVYGIGTGVLSGDSPMFYISNLQDSDIVNSKGVSSNASTSASDGSPNPETSSEFYAQYLYKTNVTVAKNASSPTGGQSAGSNVEVFRFDVTADSKADAVFNTVAFNVAGTAALSSGATGNANLYKSTDLTTSLAREAYKSVTLATVMVNSSTTSATATQGGFDGIPLGATVHIYDTSASDWIGTAKVILHSDSFRDPSSVGTDASRIEFDTALSSAASGTDVVHYQPLQPGAGKLYFGSMSYIEATSTYTDTKVTVDSAYGFAPGDHVKIWGYTGHGTVTTSPCLIVATTTPKALHFDSALNTWFDYNYNVQSATDAKVTRAVIYTTSTDGVARTPQDTIAAGTTKTYVIKGDTSGALATKTISLSIDAASDFIWGDNPTWPTTTNGVDGVTRIINARTKTFPMSTTLTY